MTNHPISLCDRFGLAAEPRPFVPSFLPPERLPKLTPEDVRKLVWEGGLPGAEGRRGKARAAFFENILECALTQDLRGVRPAMRRTFRAFLKELALRTARELHIGEISVAVGVSDKTVKAWLRAAEEIGLIWRLEAYRAEPGTCPKLLLVRSPKIHFADTGLAAHLCGIRRPEDLAGPIHEEAFFETFVVNEIRKSWMNGETGIKWVNAARRPTALLPPGFALREAHRAPHPSERRPASRGRAGARRAPTGCGEGLRGALRSPRARRARRGDLHVRAAVRLVRHRHRALDPGDLRERAGVRARAPRRSGRGFP